MAAGPFFNLLALVRGRPLGRPGVRLAELEASQWWSAERIATAQMRRLRRFLVDVGRHHPALRARFSEAGFRPELVASAGGLAGLPLVDLPDTRDDGRLAGDSAGWQRASRWRAHGWWGVRPADPILALAGDPAGLDGDLDQLLGRRPPRAVAAAGETLVRLARRAAERERAFAELHLCALFTPIDSLDEAARCAVEASLGAPVAPFLDLPGRGLIAHACPEGGLHLCTDSLVVEVVKPATGAPVRAGEAGEVVVTDTTCWSDPLVRARTAIRARLLTDPCLCGRGLPRLAEVVRA